MKRKYPKSWHLSYSEKLSSDDKKCVNENHFNDKDVIVTIKMDGENCTIYNDHTHARSLDSRIDSEDRRWIDALRKSKIEGNIPSNFRICGENLFFKHTCEYNDLKSMFYVFSIWEGDKCLSWDETVLWCGLLGLETVPVIFDGKYDKNEILDSFSKYQKNNNVEGFVVRLKDSFDISDFSISLNKYVKKSFILPSQHWRYAQKTMNKLSNGKNPWEII